MEADRNWSEGAALVVREEAETQGGGWVIFGVGGSGHAEMERVRSSFFSVTVI